MGFFSGAYTGTYNALACGQAENGWDLGIQNFLELITGDKYGDTPQDGVFRGGAVTLGATFIEWDAAALIAMLWPYGTALGTMDTAVGTLARDKGKQLILTARAGTPAAGAGGPATLTAPKIVHAEGNEASIKLAPELRRCPLSFRVWIDPANDQFFSIT